ncbi:MAG TPA: serine hydrolase [Gemmatimonadales bacterium]|nr:serine hydrolase [Gemmatimonadales bacterium]
MGFRTPFRSGLTAATLALAALPSAAVPQGPAAAAINRLMTRAAEYGQLNGAVLVADGGQIVYEHAFGLANMELKAPNTTRTRFEIASMTKPMTAILAMQLVQEGKLRLDGKISDYLPWYPSESGSRITVEQLLNHTSGIPGDIAFDEPSPGAEVVAAINADMFSNDSLVKLIARRPLQFEPGTNFGYSSDAYAVLGAIIAQVAGEPYWRALRERVLDRAGMTETGISYLAPLVPQRAAGYAQSFDGYTNAPHIGATPAGGLYSTLRDLYRFDQALYGDTLVNEQSKARLFAVRSVATAYGWKTGEDTLPDGTRRRVLRTTGGLPGFQALMVRNPDARRTIILLSNTRDLVWRFDDFAVAIGRILDGRPYVMPRRSVAEAIAASVKAGHPATAVTREFDAMRADTATFALSEQEMNQLGYFFLSRGALSQSVEVFALNVRAFPRSANVYDSMGEAQLARGDTTRAVASYRRSLELNPANTNASDVLKRIAPRP